MGISQFSYKKILFLRTNKGGGRSDKQSWLLPIVYLFQCCIFWLSGLADKHLESLGDANDVTSNSNSDKKDNKMENYHSLIYKFIVYIINETCLFYTFD